MSDHSPLPWKLEPHPYARRDYPATIAMTELQVLLVQHVERFIRENEMDVSPDSIATATTVAVAFADAVLHFPEWGAALVHSLTTSSEISSEEREEASVEWIAAIPLEHWS